MPSSGGRPVKGGRSGCNVTAPDLAGSPSRQEKAGEDEGVRMRPYSGCGGRRDGSVATSVTTARRRPAAGADDGCANQKECTTPITTRYRRTRRNVEARRERSSYAEQRRGSTVRHTRTAEPERPEDEACSSWGSRTAKTYPRSRYHLDGGAENSTSWSDSHAPRRPDARNMAVGRTKSAASSTRFTTRTWLKAPPMISRSR